MLGVMSVNQALLAAEERGLDLVEVSPNASPPVCRIMDYGKYKYQASKRAAEAKKKSARVDIKEVKMRPKTEDHDFQVKVRKCLAVSRRRQQGKSDRHVPWSRGYPSRIRLRSDETGRRRGS